MRIKQIFEELSAYLPATDIERLKINMALPGSIVMCLAIAEITKGYTSTEENEKEVTRLLSAVCKRHFKQ